MGVAGGDKWAEMAVQHVVLQTQVGSKLHGINLPGGGDDDQMGICVETMEAAVGFHEFEQFIKRDAAIREGKSDAPSQPGDMDLTIYGLRKFLRLAMQGNPTIIDLLYVPQKACSVLTEVGKGIQAMAPFILSRQAGKRYLGYLESQRQRLMGERGQKKVNRPELETAFGYDTKYACHMLRLGMQGVQLLTEGRLTIPMKQADQEHLIAVRLGKVSLNDVLQETGDRERELKDLLTESPLDEHPDFDTVEHWMLETYKEAWA